ncbi:Cna B domain-containing protein [Clostridium sp. DL-VIII]|uniref:prealbumin-like fold domain-containing protein n=1 Tax=Clostridium sp. DL-VIII TaxID=641107 RepID=UPI00023B0347|nr:prealbumin-like fold domain-containing protein [Clostridium sp. DL-VIII]EHJ01804.1 Cna B domain-containing protein [Clostridium sp. DL-VIII]
MSDTTSKDNNEKSENIADIMSEQNEEAKVLNSGEIIVISILECGENEYLQGVKINLYKINGLSPVLIESKVTNEEGKVIFSRVEEGCYRIIEIIDKRYFEKPKYISWNEIIIDNNNKKQKVVVVNKIKNNISPNKHKHCI